MITVTFMLWRDPEGQRNAAYQYGAEHVNLLKRQVARNLTQPHEFVLLCDARPDGLDAEIRSASLDRTTFVTGMRFAKLQLFAPDARAKIGARIFYLDLDTVITGSLDAIAARSEPLVLWRHPRFGRNPKVARYNSSVILLDAGVRPDIYRDFPRNATPGVMESMCRGQDQTWISKRVSEDNPYWDGRDGIYSARLLKQQALPDNAKIVTFPGRREPGLPETQAEFPWIAEYRH